MKKLYYLFLLLCLLLNGCFPSPPHMEKYEYSFDIQRPMKIRATPSQMILSVDNTAIHSQFSGTPFVYRINHFNYLRDYYHTFFSPPAQEIHESLTGYLKDLALFKYVTNDDDFGHAHYSLHSNVLELYADYRCSHQPQAIIAIHFTLFKVGTPGIKILMDETLRESIPLHIKNSDQLMIAWNKGLENIFKRLSIKLSHFIC